MQIGLGKKKNHQLTSRDVSNIETISYLLSEIEKHTRNSTKKVLLYKRILNMFIDYMSPIYACERSDIHLPQTKNFMTICIFAIKENVNGEILLLRFFFVWYKFL